jgi:hypothetical protein
MSWINGLLLLLGLIYISWQLSSLAARLDRTHIRRDSALNSLKQHLALRATAVARLVASGKLENHVAEKLKDGLEQVLDSSEQSFRDYLSAESELTGILFDIFENEQSIENLLESTQSASLVFELARAAKRVQLARRFHNDAVGASQLLHAKTTVRLFRLAGYTKVPTAVDIDDRVPNALASL